MRSVPSSEHYQQEPLKFIEFPQNFDLPQVNCAFSFWLGWIEVKKCEEIDLNLHHFLHTKDIELEYVL